MENYFERSKKAWESAGGFPPDKEKVYPEHGKVQEFDSIKARKVYEYGCGGGSDVLSYLRRGNDVTASDIVSRNLDVTRERIEKSGLVDPKYRLILLEDSSPIPLPDNDFDVISSHGVLHHIIDPLPVIKELHRICKTDGLVYVMLYSNVLEDHFNELGLIQRFMRENSIGYNEAYGWCTDSPGTPYSRSYTVEQGAEFLEDHGGFTLVDYNYWNNDFFVTYKGVKS